MAPIRVGIIGLSATAKTAWASAAHLPYLNASKDKYVITALCNSSVDSAKSAIETFGLPQSTRAYGDPEDLANDDQVDLVVCSTRVDVHYPTIKPSIEKGKDVFVEWPLAQDLKHAEELTNLAKEKGSRTMVGLQSRKSPVILKVKSMVEEGKIGNVLSSSVVSFGGTNDRTNFSAGIKYFTDRSVGGNLVTIYIGHISEYVHFTLGEFSSLSSKLVVQRPEVGIVDSNGKVTERVSSDVPDLVSIIGELDSGASMSISLRRGQQFKDSPGFLWNIHGELGEIRVTASSPAFVSLDAIVKVEVHSFAKDEVEEIKWEPHGASLPPPARNIGALYEQFALGANGQYPDFDDAVKRHRYIEAVYKSSDEGKRVSYQH